MTVMIRSAGEELEACSAPEGVSHEGEDVRSGSSAFLSSGFGPCGVFPRHATKSNLLAVPGQHMEMKMRIDHHHHQEVQLSGLNAAANRSSTTV